MNNLSKDFFAEALRRMYRIRFFEEKTMEMYFNGDFPGSVHLSIGQEASIVGACMALRDDDYMVGTHRSHGHSVGKNADVKGLMAELLGRVDGVNRGKGGSMHLADKTVGSLGETSIVGSGLPIANGAAFAAKTRGTDQVCLVFYSDGSANEGAAHEAMNIASVFNLPVVFACENNGVAVTTMADCSSKIEDLCDRAAGYGMPGEKADGQDPVAVYEMVKRAVDRARANEGPSIVEMKTWRFQEHGEGALFRALLKKDPYYRASYNHDEWLKEREPIALFLKYLLDNNILSQNEIDGIRSKEFEIIEEAERFAKASPFPDASEAYAGIFSTPVEN